MRPSAEMQFLYGNHVLKSGLGRITEGTPAYTGVVSVPHLGCLPALDCISVQLEPQWELQGHCQVHLSFSCLRTWHPT